MDTKPTTAQPFYSDSFKLGVIRRIANGEITKEQARREALAANPSTTFQNTFVTIGKLKPRNYASR